MSGLRCEVVTPEKRVIAEQVDEVVLPGSEGYLGVLPGHAPLLARLGIGRLTYAKGGTRRHLAIAGGFAEVLPDRVIVLADIAETPESIDRDRAGKSRDRALERLRGRGADIDVDRAQAALQKALVRLQVVSGAGPDQPA